MKCFLDTSVLVPVFVDEHPHHEASLTVFLRADKKHYICGAHSLAEVYSTLTRLPGTHRASPTDGLLFLQNMAARLTFVSLDVEEYWAAISTSAEAGIAGGLIYDALLGSCALKANVDVIYTWDLDHFRRLGPEVAKRVRTP